MFTIPGEPFRTRVAGLPEFVTTLGGAYFFLPGRRALRYLALATWRGVVVRLDTARQRTSWSASSGWRAGSTRSSGR